MANGQWARNNQNKAETFENQVANTFHSNESQSYDLNGEHFTQSA